MTMLSTSFQSFGRSANALRTMRSSAEHVIKGQSEEKRKGVAFRIISSSKGKPEREISIATPFEEKSSNTLLSRAKVSGSSILL